MSDLNINELKKNIEIMEGTFDKFGLEVLNVGVTFVDAYRGNKIDVYCEVMSKEAVDIYDDIYIKVNFYKLNNELLIMGSEGIDLDDFSGYNTVKIETIGKDLFTDAVKARLYISK